MSSQHSSKIDCTGNSLIMQISSSISLFEVSELLSLCEVSLLSSSLSLISDSSSVSEKREEHDVFDEDN